MSLQKRAPDRPVKETASATWWQGQNQVIDESRKRVIDGSDCWSSTAKEVGIRRDFFYKIFNIYSKNIHARLLFKFGLYVCMEKPNRFPYFLVCRLLWSGRFSRPRLVKRTKCVPRSCLSLAMPQSLDNRWAVLGLNTPLGTDSEPAHPFCKPPSLAIIKMCADQIVDVFACAPNW